MKTPLLSLITLLLLTGLVSCGESHFISDSGYRLQVEKDFQVKKQGLPSGNLFTVFENKLSVPEREALMFLYAYMPIGDITDYPGDYYLENVRLSFKAQKEMPWGETVPEELFRHFVLPVRVNNENLDNSRTVFYDELKERVKNLPLADAILEVNHWCHEKVIYSPSDARTSSPLASVRTAFGRCGEESTFTVAALRSVGIPARQVYTPRWAHTDDNHAWVEAWADGKWHFLGACEPEPVLDLGWFNAPASRGMLMHTKVFGRYTGPEEIMSETPNYTEINIIGNYAPATTATVTVTTPDGRPVPGAKVEFKLYNYAEFYTVAHKQTDREGKASLTAGKGDMLVWASDNGKFGFGKLSFAKDKTLTIVLDRTEGDDFATELNIVPPPESGKLPEVTPEQQAANEHRLAVEDSIRNAYVATFPTVCQAGAFAREHGLDSARTVRLIRDARGNYRTILEFLDSSAARGKSDRAVSLLEVVSAKDLRDVAPEVLADHLANSPEIPGKADDNARNLLNPRVANEMLTPYKGFFLKEIPIEDAARFRSDPQTLVEWCSKEITIRNAWNPQSIPISPAGVWKARVADEQSRDIFFVSVARSLGIPAWIDPVTGKIHYKEFSGMEPQGGKIREVDFRAHKQANAPTGNVSASYRPVPTLDNPKYYTHFTLSKFRDGTFELLNYEEGDGDDATSWASLLKNGTTLDAGYYMLVTGTRMASGEVLSRIRFFTVRPGTPVRTELVMRQSNDRVQVIGNLDSEARYTVADGSTEQSILQTTGRGYFVVGILGCGQEPTNHALRDIAALGKSFEQWGRPLLLLFPSREQYLKFRSSDFPGLPANITYGIDRDNRIQEMITGNMKLKKGNNLPVFVIADTFNRVVFVSQGYTIGLGEQLMKTIRGI